MVLSIAEGQQTAVISTEHTLASSSVTGTFVLSVDVSNMATSDTLEIRTFKRARSSTTERLFEIVTLNDAQTHLVVDSLPFPSDGSVSVSIKQTAGTGRAFDWNLITL